MLPELLYSEESYTLSADKKTYDVYMISFWHNERPCFRVYLNKEAENLFTWDQQSGSLQQMDGKKALPVELVMALEAKIVEGIGKPALT